MSSNPKIDALPFNGRMDGSNALARLEDLERSGVVCCFKAKDGERPVTGFIVSIFMLPPGTEYLLFRVFLDDEMEELEKKVEERLAKYEDCEKAKHLACTHHENCDYLGLGPDLRPSTKPCNCRGRET